MTPLSSYQKVAVTPFERLLQNIALLGEDDFQRAHVPNSKEAKSDLLQGTLRTASGERMSAKDQRTLNKLLRKALTQEPGVSVASGGITVPPEGRGSFGTEFGKSLEVDGKGEQAWVNPLSGMGKKRVKDLRDASKVVPSFEDAPVIEDNPFVDNQPGEYTTARGVSSSLEGYEPPTPNPMTEEARAAAKELLKRAPSSDQGDKIRYALRTMDGKMGQGNNIPTGKKMAFLRELMGDPSAHNITAGELKTLAPNSWGLLRWSVNQNLKEYGGEGWGTAYGTLSKGAPSLRVGELGRQPGVKALLKRYSRKAAEAFYQHGNVAAAGEYGKAIFALKSRGDVAYAQQSAANAKSFLNARKVLTTLGPQGAMPSPQAGVATRHVKLPIEREGFAGDEGALFRGTFKKSTPEGTDVRAYSDRPTPTPPEGDLAWRGGRPPYVRRDRPKLGGLASKENLQPYVEELRSMRGLGGQPVIPPWGKASLGQHLQGKEVVRRIKAEQKLQVPTEVRWEKAPKRGQPFWEHIQDPGARRVAKALQKGTAKNPLPSKWMEVLEVAARKGDPQAPLFLEALRNMKKGAGVEVLEEVGPQGLKYLTKLVNLLK